MALYKTSGTGYRFLSRWFALPSKKTLSRLLVAIPVDEGLNKFLFEQLKEAVSQFKETEKNCVLMFDEVALMPHLDNERHNDRLVGIQENGTLLDHALVFMVRGIFRK